jgi:hypothetical protein
LRVKRLWTTSLFLGSATVADPSAKLSQSTPIVGSVGIDGSTVSGTSQWFSKKLAPYTLQWSMTDAG